MEEVFLSSVEIAWITGIFDGEGCIHVHPKDNGVTLSVSMSDEDVIQRLYALVNCGNVRKERAAGNRKKDQYIWYTSKKRDVLRLLCAMSPLLSERRRNKAMEAVDQLAKVPYLYGESGCGSTGGYAKHKRRNEDPCEPCAEASRQYSRDYRARQKVAK